MRTATAGRRSAAAKTARLAVSPTVALPVRLALSLRLYACLLDRSLLKGAAKNPHGKRSSARYFDGRLHQVGILKELIHGSAVRGQSLLKTPVRNNRARGVRIGSV